MNKSWVLVVAGSEAVGGGFLVVAGATSQFLWELRFPKHTTKQRGDRERVKQMLVKSVLTCKR